MSEEICESSMQPTSSSFGSSTKHQDKFAHSSVVHEEADQEPVVIDDSQVIYEEDGVIVEEDRPSCSNTPVSLRDPSSETVDAQEFYWPVGARSAPNTQELWMIDPTEVPAVAAFEEVAPSSNSLTSAEAKARQYPTTYVERNRRWTYKSAGALATADEDGQLYYNPDPFRPAPPMKGAPSTLVRMHYAARRLENRKYRAQKSLVRATNQMESASCEKCNMRFFLPYNRFRSNISYSIPPNMYALPTTYFRCPLCSQETQIYM